MTQTRTAHLDDQELDRALVDAAGLAHGRGAHLAACPLCRSAVDRSRKELAALGRQAADLSPAPRKPIVLPAASSRQRSRWILPWPAAVGATVMVVLAVFSFYLNRIEDPVRDTGVVVEQVAEADRLMQEAGWLAEDALPETFQAIADTDGFDFEEFIEFVVPSPNNDPLSYTPIRKGDGLC